MEYITIGKTRLLASRTAFDTRALFASCKVQTEDELLQAQKLVQSAYNGGINLFDIDTYLAQSNTSALAKVLKPLRKHSLISLHSNAINAKQLKQDITCTCELFESDHIDILHIESNDGVPKLEQENGVYKELSDAKNAGRVQCISYKANTYIEALDAILSGLYDAINYPLCVNDNDDAIKIIKMCEQTETGFFASRAFTNALSQVDTLESAFAFIRQFENVIPLWQFESEEMLKTVLALEAQEVLV